MLCRAQILNQFIQISESDKREGKSVRDRLNESLNAKLTEVEKKREKAIILDKKIAKLPDGPERRKLIYQKQQQENYNRRHKKYPIDEERALHESYQIIMKVKYLNFCVIKEGKNSDKYLA